MIGKTISHYKILEKLGEGGMGVVYKAQDTKLDRFVALKFLPPHLGKNKEEKERFIHEAKAASALDHNNICNIHEIDETEDGQLFIAMAHYEGQTLDQKIKQGPLSLEVAIDIATQIAHGLEKAHKKEIVHRDIKPGNILLTSDHVVKILDFGLAKLRGRTKLTKQQTTLGTVAYMSPEQSQGKKVDIRSDIWSLGVVLYEMITGKRPFKGDYDQAMIYSIMNEEPEPLTSLRTGVPLELERIVNKILSKQPDERYQHVNELAVDLKKMGRELKSEKTVSVVSGMALKKPLWKKPVPVLIGFLGLIVLVIGVVWTSSRANKIYRDKWIAVLPFDPITRAVEDTIFCDGIHDALLTQLQKIGDLHPIARTTMISYRNSGKRPMEIARELRVKHVIEGSVQRAGNRILITVQLIDGRTDDHIWSDDYQKEYSDIFAVQLDVAQNVARECKAKITPEEQYAMEHIPTRNMEAWDLYQKGKWYWDTKSTTEGNKKAAQFLEKAVSLDGSFALAWAKLSIINTTLGDAFGLGGPYKIRAKTALAMSEEIDPNLPEVHAARGEFLQYIKKDYNGAIEAYNKALAGAPNNSQYYYYIGNSYNAHGQIDKALDNQMRSYELDPNSYFAPMALFHIYYPKRMWFEADKYASLLISKHPENPVGYRDKARVYLQGYGQIEKARTILEEGWNLADEPSMLIFWHCKVEIFARDYETALEINERNPARSDYSYDKANMLSLAGRDAEAKSIFDSLRVVYEQRVKNNPDNADFHCTLGWFYAQLGRKDEAIREGMLGVELNPKAGGNSDYYLMLIYIKAGEHDKAIENIKTQLSAPSWSVTRWRLKLDPLYDPLRDDPRFQALLK